ncbi:MAG: hydroxymethylpyrimidine/phosphomethylpyrimidine kinase [Gammaproteobacteria bacterium]|nr:hydroxymethylpyrimidine/phosphomethylpyrimidine kinase [Gammaproteobacteria bacterium]
MTSTPAILLIIAGLDPSGGAGLAADIETAVALGVHPAPVASLITVQDTVNVSASEPLAPELVVDQAEAVLADLPIAAIKLGALGTAAIGSAVADLLARHPDIAVVTDPVLAAAGGGRLAESELIAVYRERLFPLSRLATPNREELALLAPEDGAAELLALGLPACLVTDGEGRGDRIVHELHTDEVHLVANGPRLEGSFHGSGCTLASAIAARIALGDDLEEAIHRAGAFVQKAVAQAYQPGQGQKVPKRW